MSTQKTEEYRTAEEFTWMNRVEGLRYIIAPENMDRPYPFLTPLEVVPGVVVPASIGYQALSINHDPTMPGRFFMSHYYGPVVKIIKIRATEDGGVELHEDGVIAWAKTQWGTDCRGGFPENSPGSDSKRMHGILRHPEIPTDLLVWRNGETQGFFHLSSYTTSDGMVKWRLVGFFNLDGENAPNHYIEAANFMGDVLYVLRSKQDGTPAWLEAYNLDGSRRDSIPDDLLPPKTPFLYGIGVRNGKLYYITSVWKSVTVPRGIYRGSELVVPDVCGDGIAFHNCDVDGDGDAYVTQYNDGRGHQATPAYLIRVPAKAFQTP